MTRRRHLDSLRCVGAIIVVGAQFRAVVRMIPGYCVFPPPSPEERALWCLAGVAEAAEAGAWGGVIGIGLWMSVDLFDLGASRGVGATRPLRAAMLLSVFCSFVVFVAMASVVRVASAKIWAQ